MSPAPFPCASVEKILHGGTLLRPYRVPAVLGVPIARSKPVYGPLIFPAQVCPRITQSNPRALLIAPGLQGFACPSRWLAFLK